MHNTLIQIKDLKDNWNDNGAKAFSSELINKADNMIDKLNRVPYVYPTARDSIQLEYSDVFGNYLEIEIFIDCTKILSIIGGDIRTCKIETLKNQDLDAVCNKINIYIGLFNF